MGVAVAAKAGIASASAVAQSLLQGAFDPQREANRRREAMLKMVNSMANSEWLWAEPENPRPAFEIRRVSEDGIHLGPPIKIYADGRVEGLEGRCFILNSIPSGERRRYWQGVAHGSGARAPD